MHIGSYLFVAVSFPTCVKAKKYIYRIASKTTTGIARDKRCRHFSAYKTEHNMHADTEKFTM